MTTRNQQDPPDNDDIKPSPFGVGHSICFWPTLAVLLLSIPIAYFCHHEYKREAIDRLGSIATSVARTVASVVEADIVRDDLGQKKNSDYRNRIQGFLGKIQKATQVNYVYIAGIAKDGGYPEYAASDQREAVRPLQPADAFPRELGDTLASGIARRTAVYPADEVRHTSIGYIISGFCPIIDSTGAIVAAVGADIGVDKGLQSAQAFGIALVCAFLSLAAITATILYLYAQNRITLPLARIGRALHKISQGDVDIAPLPVIRDEFGPVSRDVNHIASAVDSLTFGLDQALSKPASASAPIAPVPLSGKFQQLSDGIRKALTVMDNVDALVYVTEPETYRLVYFNRKMERAYAVSDMRPSERLCWKVFGDGTNQPCSYCRMQELLERRDDFPSVEWEQYNENPRGWYRIRNSIVHWLDGRIVLFCEAHDITRDKAVEEIQLRQEEDLEAAAKAAREASIMKTSFLANMSHEIRTPMNGIIGFAELAMDDPGITSKGRAHIEKIKYSAEGLLQIINDILDISKIESGKVDLDCIPFVLDDVVDRCDAVCTPKAREKGVEFYCYVESFVRQPLLGDPTKLRQVLMNLLSNAIKFTQRGVVKLACTVERATPRDISLRFEVSDSGIGMTEDQIDKVFDAFTQADNGATRKYGGTGLGLAITKNFVELMGGQLHVVSTPGIGSKFSFTLTFDIAGENRADEDAVAEAPSGSVRRPTRPHFRGDVLVCEDNDINQEVIREHLERLGLNVTLAADGREGVDEVLKRAEAGRPFDLILMDIHMPIMSGVEAAAQIHAEGCRTPIVALTANVMVSDLDNYIHMGMVDALGKPFRAAELWNCLRKHLRETPDTSQPEEPELPESDEAGLDSPINPEAGLANAAGNRDLLQRLYRNFAADNQNTMAEIKAALSAGERTVAHRLVHSLKSTSRMIGAAGLGDAAEEVEQELKNPDSASGFSRQEGLTRLSGALRRVLDDLERRIDSLGGIESSAERLDVALAKAFLDRLEPLLASGDGECLQYAGEAGSVLSGLGDVGGRLAAQMESYDFDRALRTVAEIRARLGLTDGLEAADE